MLEFRSPAGLLTLVLALAGCPSEEPMDDDTNVTDDDDGTPGDDDDTTSDDDDTTAGVILSEDTKLPEDEDFFAGVEMSEDQLVFTSSGSGEDFGFEVGSVVVGCAGDCNDGEAYLRQVTAVEISGVTATLQTEGASLTDAIESGSFDWEIPLTSREVVDLSGTVLYADNNLSLSVVSGSLSFAPTLYLDGEIHWFTVESFEANMLFDLAFDIDVQALATMSGSYGDEALIFTSVPWVFGFMLGPIPVEGTAQINVHAGFDADFDGEASVTTGFDVSTNLEMGASYQNETWSNTWDPSLSGSYHPPVVEVSSDASIRVYLRSTVETLFYHAAGPSLGIEPYLLGEATLAPPPPTFGLFGGVSGDLGFELEVFSVQLASYNVDLFDWNTLLYEYTFADDLDGDGFYDYEDCDDGDATSYPGATELCEDGADNDCDLDYDCDDVDCMYDLACLPACNNGLDDDGDGWIDLDDPGCAGDPNGSDEGGYDPTYECNDSIDNDGDGWTDANDPECGDAMGSEFFPWEVDCSDGIDDDGDGDVDCSDSDCYLDLACIPDCDNGLDDDGDGWFDLEDPGCGGDPTWDEEGGYDPTYECNDGIDNDGDGWVDASDPECGTATADENLATEVVCDDGIDDDGDGDVDCDDADCTGDPACSGPVGGYVLIPAGTFTMGSPLGEVGRFTNEEQHQVVLTRDFYIGETEVTQFDFESVMGWNPSYCNHGCGDEYPVQHLSWYDALVYANEVSVDAGLMACYVLSNVVCQDGTNVGGSYLDCMSLSREGIVDADVSLNGVATPYDCEGYRMPTEAEWEYAARAGEPASFPNGGNLYAGDESDCGGNLTLTDGSVLDDVAWYCGNYAGTCEPVGSLQPNYWGLYDMSGNVREWAWDWFANSYGGDATDPTGSGSGIYRVERGGGWDDIPRQARVAFRSGDTQGSRLSSLGCRLAMSSP